MYFDGLSYAGKMVMVPLDEKWECLLKMQTTQQRAVLSLDRDAADARGRRKMKPNGQRD